MMLQTRGIKINEFAERIGISGQGLRDVLSGKSRHPKANIISAIARQLDVTSDWLLFGSEAYLETTAVGEPTLSYKSKSMPMKASSLIRPIPIVPLNSYAQFIENGGNLMGLENLQRLSLPETMALTGEAMGFEVEGDSLMPEIKPGSIMVGTVEEGKLAYVKSGHYYAVLYAGHFSIGRILNRIEADKVIDINPANQAFPPIAVKMADIKKIWRLYSVLQRV